MIRLHYQLLGSLSVASNLLKCISYPSNPTSQTSEPNNLTVIHKKIDINAKFSNILIEDCRVSSFKHNLFYQQVLRHRLDNIYPPCLHIFGDTLRLNHHPLNSSINKLFPEIHNLGAVTGSDFFECRSFGITTSSELDSELLLCFETVTIHPFNKPKPVIWWE